MQSEIGHIELQAPQPIHFSSITKAASTFILNFLIASVGQTGAAHNPHLIHKPSSIKTE